MAVLSWREVMPRTLQQRLGESPTAERRVIATLDGPTPTQTIISAVGILIGSPHPEFSFLGVTEAQFEETDRQHAQITYRYELTPEDDRENDPNPLLRPDIWAFSVGGAAVPITYYLDDNDRRRPLVNAAGDLIENQTTEEAEIRATITGNRPQFPLQLAAFVTNSLNSNAYLGGRPFTWKCAGLSGTQQLELVNDQEVRYYQITTELVYRASGWPLILPDAGFNFRENGQKKRCFVEMPDDAGGVIRVPTANAVPLAENGQMLPADAEPRLLVRRVHRAVNFSAYFGTPGF
jgi:hypothetical protein